MTLSVLHVHSGNMMGGIESVLLTVAQHARTVASMEHTYTVCFEGAFSRQLSALGFEPLILPGVRLSRPWSVIAARKALRDRLHDGGFDVAICHSPWSHAVFAPAIADSATPLVLWMHGIATGEPLVERLASRYPPDLVIANSARTEASLATIFKGVVSEVLHNPVTDRSTPTEPGSRSRTRSSLGVADDEVVVLMVARLEPGKGQDVLLRALSQLREDRWRCWMTAVPQGNNERDYLERLESTAVELGITERLTLVGPEYRAVDLYSAADIFSHPNTVPEGFGMVFVEALQFGLPVVTTAHGGALDIVTDDCGVLVPPQDPTALARVLKELIRNSARRTALGNAGRARADSIARPSRQLEKLHDILVPLAQRALE